VHKLLRAIALALLLAVSQTLDAQNQNSFYRGVNVTRYQFSFNGNPYWFYPDFQKGSIFYDGKYYSDLMININSYEQRPEVLRNGDSLPIELKQEKTAYIIIGNSYYLNLNYAGYEAPKGIYQLIGGKEDFLFKQINKELLHNTENANGNAIGYYDKHFNDNILTCFGYSSTIWVLKSNVLYKIRKPKDLENLYPNQKAQIKRARQGIKRNDVERWCLAFFSPNTIDNPSLLVLKEAFKQRKNDLNHTEYGDNLPESALIGAQLPTKLPEDFFVSDEQNSEVVQYIAGSTVKAIYQNKLYELGDKTRKGNSNKTISGVVYNSATGDPVPYAVISDQSSGNYTHCDRMGRYSINLPCGENIIHFSESTMDDLNIMVNVFDNAQMDAVMNEKTITLNSAYITADSRQSHRIIKMGLEKLMMRTLKKVPTAFGEADVLKAVQSLPGVQSVGEASSGINVRGGSADQNLILYNDNTIYNPSHLFGIFSSFNPNTVDGVELYKSSIPVEYGGRISSVLDVKGKEGNMKKFAGAVGIGVLTSHGYIEAPIKKDTTSFVLGGRTTYSDWILGKLPQNSFYSNGGASFHDVNFGLTHKFTSENVLKADIYWSADKFNFSTDTLFSYNNLNASLRWKAPIGEKSKFSLSLGYDSYDNSLQDNGSEFYEYRLSTGIKQAFLRTGIKTELGEKHTLSYGLEAIGYAMNPGIMVPNSDSSLVVASNLKKEYAIQPAIWVGDSWQINNKFSLEYGLRATGIYAVESKKFYFSPDIRISTKYTFNEDLSFKAAFSSTSQYIHLISNTSSISPMDTWKLCDENIKPQRGWQIASGLYYTALSGMLDFSVEGYRKGIDNYLDYKTGATLVMNENLSQDLVQTRGKAYGVELMAKKVYGKLTGWLSYTYSRTQLQEKGSRGLETINKGKWYNAPYDKPNDFKLAANYSITHRYSISANVNYSTGRPITAPIGKYYYGNDYRLVYSDRNASRIPDYFRLDLALNVEPSHYLKKLTYFSITAGVYNVTGRHNAYSVYYRAENQMTRGYLLSIFAVPVPYLTINMRF